MTLLWRYVTKLGSHILLNLTYFLKWFYHFLVFHWIQLHVYSLWAHHRLLKMFVITFMWPSILFRIFLTDWKELIIFHLRVICLDYCSRRTATPCHESALPWAQRNHSPAKLWIRQGHTSIHRCINDSSVPCSLLTNPIDLESCSRHCHPTNFHWFSCHYFTLRAYRENVSFGWGHWSSMQRKLQINLIRTRCSISFPTVPKRSSTNRLMIPVTDFPVAGLPAMGSSDFSHAASISDRSRASVKASFVLLCCGMVPCIQCSKAYVRDCKEYSTSQHRSARMGTMSQLRGVLSKMFHERRSASFMSYAGCFSLAVIYGGWLASGGSWHTTSRFCPWRMAVLRSVWKSWESVGR